MIIIYYIYDTDDKCIERAFISKEKAEQAYEEEYSKYTWYHLYELEVEE